MFTAAPATFHGSPLVSGKQKQTTRNGAGRVHHPAPLLIEDTVKAAIGDLIADADAGADDVP